MPGRAARQCIAAATGANGAERHCPRTPRLTPAACHHVGVGTTAGEKRGVPTASPANASEQPGPGGDQTALLQVFQDGPASAGRKRQALSTPSTGEHSDKGAFRYLSLRIQTIQSCITARNPITTAGATLIRARMCVHVFSPSNLHFGGADGARPCVKYRFNSYTSRGLTAACRLYIQNEGLRENFWEDRENGKAE